MVGNITRTLLILLDLAFKKEHRTELIENHKFLYKTPPVKSTAVVILTNSKQH